MIRSSLVRARIARYATKAPESVSNLKDNFWEKISVEKSPEKLVVKMGSSPIKTPLGKPLEIPPAKDLLAELVAQEWKIMSSLKLKNYHIPMTSLAARAIDTTPEERADVSRKLLPYLDTDTLLVIAPEKDCEGRLRKAQLELFPPVVDDASKVWGIDSLNVLDQELQLFGNYQTEETQKKVLDWVNSLDAFKFAALERATTSARSFIIGMNVALNRRPVEELAALASLDVTIQTDIWGEVEDTHDVDKVDIRRLLGAAWLASL